MTKQLKTWLEYKYRTHNEIFIDETTGKHITKVVTPQLRPTDLVFGIYHRDGSNTKLKYLYRDLSYDFKKILKRIGKEEVEESNGRRSKITLHSFRRFAKTTISDLGHQDFSEWYIGHAGSTYWTKKDSDKAAIFRKLEKVSNLFGLVNPRSSK
jgi:hypothetical protein